MIKPGYFLNKFYLPFYKSIPNILNTVFFTKVHKDIDLKL